VGRVAYINQENKRGGAQMSQHALVESFEKLVRSRYLKDTVRVTLDSSSVTKKMVKITLVDDFVGMGFGIERELLEAMTIEDGIEEDEIEEDAKPTTAKRMFKRK
jgi:hypothetical protein